MAYGPSQRRKVTKREVREVNLIPIMNLFIVVIPMLMTIMVSAHLALSEITLKSSGGGNGEGIEEEAIDPPKEMTLGLFNNRFEIQVDGEDEARKIPILEDGSFNFIELDKQLSALKEEHQTQSTMQVLPDDNVAFDVLLRSIDVCKSNQFVNIKYMTAQKKLIRAAS